MMLLGIVLYIILDFVIICDVELSSFNVLFEKSRNTECSKILNNFYQLVMLDIEDLSFLDLQKRQGYKILTHFFNIQVKKC